MSPLLAELIVAKKREPKKSSLRIVQLQESAAYWAENVLDGTCAGLAIVGPGGLGKTHVVESLLAKRRIETEHIGKNSHITPLALYQTLYEHRNREVILLDDIEHVYKQEVSVGILRSALWGKKVAGGRRRRVVTYTTSKEISVPDRFEYSGGIILIGNKIPRQDDPIVEALLTRIPTIEFSIAPSDIYEFMRSVIVDRTGYAIYDGKKGRDVRIPRNQCLRVIEELKNRRVTDLRKLEHALIAWRDFKEQPARLKRELDNIARKTPAQAVHSQPPKEQAKAIFLELVQDVSMAENEKADLFSERTRGLRPGQETGYNRATYFRWKAKWVQGSF